MWVACVLNVCVCCVCVWHVWKYLPGDSSPQSGTCMCRFHWGRQISGFQECLYLFLSTWAVTKNPLKWLSFFLSFWLCCVAHGILVPRQGIEPGSFHWKRGILAPGLPEKSPHSFFVAFSNPPAQGLWNSYCFQISFLEYTAGRVVRGALKYCYSQVYSAMNHISETSRKGSGPESRILQAPKNAA